MSRIQFDPEAIRALATILSDTGLTEIEIVEADSRIRVARAAVPVVAPVAMAAPPVAASPAPAAAVPAAAPPAEIPAGETVKSPMVGIAYLSAEPGSPPFVMPGQAVTAGQTVLLIEAMKTFNQIKVPRAGTVTRLLVGNGQPVEYDQPLLVIE